MQFLKKRNSGRLIIPLMIVALLIGIVCLPSSEQSSQSDIGQMEEIFSPTKEDLRQTYEEPVRIDLSAQQEEVNSEESAEV